MECEYCNKIYSNSYTLRTHQKTTRSCLDIQSNKGITSNKKLFQCSYCNKDITTKVKFDHHLLICKEKIKKDTLSISDNIFKKKEVDLENKLKSKDDTIKELQQTNKELHQTNKELQETIVMLRNELQLYKDKEKSHKTTYKKTQIPKALKKMVWNLYVGSNVAETACLCCQQEKITMLQFHCGHVIPECKLGFNTPENLRPICGPCNMSMGTQDMREFIKKYFQRDLPQKLPV
jgi:hypothetical protein